MGGGAHEEEQQYPEDGWKWERWHWRLCM